MIEFLVMTALALYCAETSLKVYRRARPPIRRWLRARRERADRWAVFLEDHGPRKLHVVKVIRDHTNMDLDAAKKASEGVPAPLARYGLLARRRATVRATAHGGGRPGPGDQHEGSSEGGAPMSPEERAVQGQRGVVDDIAAGQRLLNAQIADASRALMERIDAGEVITAGTPHLANDLAALRTLHERSRVLSERFQRELGLLRELEDGR